MYFGKIGNYIAQTAERFMAELNKGIDIFDIPIFRREAFTVTCTIT